MEPSSPRGHHRSPTRNSYPASAFSFTSFRSMSPNRRAASSSSSSSMSLRSVSPRGNLQARFSGPPSSRGGGAACKKSKPVTSAAQPKRTCMCAPTTHPGSFRCSLHRKSTPSFSKLNAGRTAMTNSLVRIGSVEGEWVRRALTTLIRPSSHQIRRRTSFQPQPSRLRHMTRAEDLSRSVQAW